jgi:hypothetical protein
MDQYTNTIFVSFLAAKGGAVILPSRSAPVCS